MHPGARLPRSSLVRGVAGARMPVNPHNNQDLP